jgi:hypothetical protein
MNLHYHENLIFNHCEFQDQQKLAAKYILGHLQPSSISHFAYTFISVVLQVLMHIPVNTYIMKVVQQD